MTNAASRFEHWLTKLETYLETASKQHSPSKWLLANDGRTVFFMLEGLCKLYEGMHNKKRFEKLKEQFKQVEDGLGRIDYYQAFAEGFRNETVVSHAVISFLQKQADIHADIVDTILKKEKWIGKKANRIEKVRKKIKTIDWLDSKDESKAIRKVYEETIKELQKMMKDIGPGFTEVESQVHALRRKMRWLSIYPQALQGKIQLTLYPSRDPLVLEYLTDKVINSPFNKMPEAGSNKSFLLLERDHFFAMSWMIFELGNLKDEGLKVFAVAEALEHLEGLNHTTALKKAGQLISGDEAILLSILNQATGISKKYFSGRHLEKLIYGVAGIIN